MKIKCPLPAIITLFFITAITLLPQQDNDPVSIGVYKKIRSQILNEDRMLTITLPREYESTNLSYPVIYHLYADRIEQYLAESVSNVYNLGSTGVIPPFILIGIDEKQLRYRDLLPLNNDGTPTGIENFIRFIKEELFPFVEKNYRTKNFRILAGPQVGANFGIYTLCKYPELFNAFILTSPFRWSGGRDLLLEMSREFFSRTSMLNKFLSITFDESDRLAKEGAVYVRNFEKLVSGNSPENFRLNIHFIEGSSDFNTPLRLKEGLKSLFESYPLPAEKQIENLAALIEYYNNLSGLYGFPVDVPEHVLTFVSDGFDSQKKIKERLEVLEFILKIYPQSVNALWRLANYYKGTGEKARALNYFEECLKIMPDFGAAKENVRILKLELEKK